MGIPKVLTTKMPADIPRCVLGGQSPPVAPALCYYYDDDCYFRERKGAEGAEQESQADNMLSSEPNQGSVPQS